MTAASFNSLDLLIVAGAVVWLVRWWRKGGTR